MKYSIFCLLMFAAASSLPAQQSAGSVPATASPGTASGTAFAYAPNLSIEKLGPDDLIGVAVYDAPELSRSYRIDTNGAIRMPMVPQPVHAAGLLPPQLENAIANALIDAQVLVNPVVTVTVVEFHSRPITVIGAVHNPLTFQATGPVTLLDAITRAGGVLDTAGSQILISRSSNEDSASNPEVTRRISLRTLLDGSDPAADPLLAGGETIRVAPAGRIYVVGDVKRPGPFTVSEDEPTSSIMKALSLAGGLDSFASRTAYIYRFDAAGEKNEIPVNLHRILARKSPDVALYPSDMLYVPNANGLRVSSKTLEIAGGVGIGVASFLLYSVR